jgi:FAD dependent oxidoreductase TIGR03364
VLQVSGLWHERAGSLHLAYRDDEARVLREFAAVRGPACELLDVRQVRAKSRAVKLDGLQLALWSPTETCVDPREVIACLPGWLTRQYGVAFRFGQAVTGYDPPRVYHGSASISTDRLWVCSGDDFHSLFPEALQALGLIRCKLQMMRSQPFASEWRLGPMLAGGLTLRHYAAFAECPSLPALRRRVASESPQFDRYGIHVMASQNQAGEVVIGDSHEYGDAIEPFDKSAIDDLVLDYLHSFVAIPGLHIASRWHGTYVKHPTQPYAVVHPAAGATAVTGVGGAGMTLSFGLAEQVVGDVIGAV